MCTYSIRYNDGDAESMVPRFRVRGRGVPAGDADAEGGVWRPAQVLEPGDRVDVYHGGGRRLFPAVVAAAPVAAFQGGDSTVKRG